MIPLRSFGKYGVVADSQDQALPIGTWSDSRNIRFSGLSFEKMLEPTLEIAWDADTNGTARWLQGWSDGVSTYFAVATDVKLWFWSASSSDSGTWVDATHAAGDYPIGQWQSFEWGDTVVFNNGKTAPQVFNQSSVQFEDLPGWGLISTASDLTEGSDPSSNTGALCSVILPYKSFLVALGVTEGGTYQPNTVWWSDSTPLVGLNTGVNGTGGPPDWDYESPGSLSGKSEVGVGNGALTWGAVLNENLICYTDASATAMQAVGGRQVMSFRRLFNKGCAGLHLASEFNNQHYVVASDQLYIHDGSSVKLIAKDRVEEEFFTRAGKGGRFGGGVIDFTEMQLVKNPDRKEIILLFGEVYQGTVLKPECEPYACDAFLEGLEAQADNVWPSADHVSGELIPSIGSTNLDVSINGYSYFNTDEVITDDCYAGSWRRQSNGTGNAGMAATHDLYTGTEVLTLDGGSIGSLVRFDDDGESNEFNGSGQSFLTRQVRSTYDGWAGYNTVYVDVYNSTDLGTTYEPGLVLAFSSHWNQGGALQVSIDWDARPDSPADPHVYQLNTDFYVSGTPGAQVINVEAELLLDGVAVLSEHRWFTSTRTEQYRFADHAAIWNWGDAVKNRSNNLYHNSAGFSADVSALLGVYKDRNEVGYSTPSYCDTYDGYLPSELNRRSGLVYNFEDDNYTWMDASVDDGAALIEVASMTYAFNPGWQVRWSDLNDDGATWDSSAGTLLSATTTWADFYSHGTEKNLYWLAEDGVYRSDQAVKTDGVKDYYVERLNIDFDDIVQSWTTNKFKHLRQFYFHAESPTPVTGANNFDMTVGWSKTLMDDPDWETAVTVSLQDTDNSGAYKADLRTTGRYLAMRLDFDETAEIKMSGGDADVIESHGR